MIFFFACAGALGLAYIVATSKINFPLLFDSGLVSICLALPLWAHGVESGDLMPKNAALMFCLGFILLAASTLRQRKIRKDSLRNGEPKEIDGRHMGKIQGGKQ